MQLYVAVALGGDEYSA